MKTVLVVDDEPRLAETLVLILRASGYGAAAAYNGNEGLRMVRQERPDVVLSDVVMPGMNGIDLAIQISKECPGLPVLLISGNAATGDLLEDARRQGYSFELLAKPLHPEEILARVASVLAANARGKARRAAVGQ